jgi:hypothetical protein
MRIALVLVLAALVSFAARTLERDAASLQLAHAHQVERALEIH